MDESERRTMNVVLLSFMALVGVVLLAITASIASGWLGRHGVSPWLAKVVPDFVTLAGFLWGGMMVFPWAFSQKRCAGPAARLRDAAVMALVFTVLVEVVHWAAQRW